MTELLPTFSTLTPAAPGLTLPAPAPEIPAAPVIDPAAPVIEDLEVLAPPTVDVPPRLLGVRRFPTLLVPLVGDLLGTAIGAAAIVVATTGPRPSVLAAALVVWVCLLVGHGGLSPAGRRGARVQRLRSVVRPACLLALGGCVAAELTTTTLPLGTAGHPDLTAGQALGLAAALAGPVALGRVLTPVPAPSPVIVAGASAAGVDHVSAAFRRAEPRRHVLDVLLGAGDAVASPGEARRSVADLADVAAGLDARTVVLVPSDGDHPMLVRRLQWELETSGRRLLLAPGPLDIAPTRAATWHVQGQPLIEVRPSRHASRLRGVLVIPERLVAGVALLLVAPLLLVVAALVRLDSPGPALFRQSRVGRGGHEFVMYKFRTMSTGAVVTPDLVNEADGALFKIRQDPRITRIGAVLRRYSVDELPQLINVALGTMSLVGPRPALPGEVATYDDDTRRRLAVRPGITGLWQVSGRSDLSWRDTVRLDLYYVDNWSVGLDLRILARTIGAVVSHRGAY